MKWLLLVVGVGMAGGCDKPRLPVVSETASVVVDSIRIADLFKAVENDSVDNARMRIVIDSLEQLLPQADSIRRPILLLALGRIKSLYMPERGYRTPNVDDAFVKRRGQEFWFNEVGGNYLYRGADFERLIKEYPGHEFVDDAAYEITLLARGGECEGYVDCYAGWTWEKIEPFLKRYPTSPFVRLALDRFFENYELALEQTEDLGMPTEMYTPTSVKAILLAADSAIAVLPETVRAPAQARSRAIWQKFADAEAKSGFISTRVPDVAPDTVPAWINAEASRGTTPLPCVEGDYVKDVIAVAFVEQLNQYYRQAAADVVRGNVIGGSKAEDGRSYYWIKLSGVDEMTICGAIELLKERNSIERVVAIPFGGKP